MSHWVSCLIMFPRHCRQLWQNIGYFHMRFRCKIMMQIIGLTLRGLIKGARVTDRRTGVQARTTDRRVDHRDDDGMMAVAILFSNYSLDSKTIRQTKYMIVRTSFIVLSNLCLSRTHGPIYKVCVLAG
jgi:hypothetical protein